MDEIKLSDDVFEQIKDFNYRKLTEEQESLIDKLITDKELKERYKKNGLCDESEGGFGTTFKAVWKDGPWGRNNNGQLERKGETKVTLKCLHNSQDITADFFKEIESNILVCESTYGWVVRCFGITKDPKTNNFTMVMNLKSDPLKRPKADELQKLFTDIFANWKEDSEIDKQINEANEINEKPSSTTVQSPTSSTSALSYMTHPQAVYTSRLLDFKNLLEPTNADKNDLEYSDSLKMDFTKLDINSKDESN
ncbi:uncharacterized protein OCT59_003712 [Rhizophagus irregularis]|uniref:uncharacterized protein n=1 Tax=Rhizophagus irregularis TaxID=588596 RepID=UPI00332B7F48|nr:hypothetical protein OCT59_003712 [Rhizophagus irregularis]